MAELFRLAAHLDTVLKTRAVGDYEQARNGLQLENSGTVTRIGAAVDACEAVLMEAVERGIDLLLVHHGLFWQAEVFTGATYRKVKAAMGGNLAIYSSHLPLDLHPELGNSALLGAALGLPKGEPAYPAKGQQIGFKMAAALPLAELARRLEQVLGGPVHVCAGGPAETRRIGIVTGGAGSEIAQSVAEGVDTFITGEGPHWSYILAEEAGINVLYGGHYATEVFGVKALAAHLSEQFGLPWEFLDHPTGL